MGDVGRRPGVVAPDRVRPGWSSWPAPSRPIPGCCCWTSRARASTSTRPRRSGAARPSLAAEGRAVLLVEHDTDLVLRVCDTVHVLDFGQVIASGTPDEIRGDPVVQAAYLGRSGGRPSGGPDGPAATRVRPRAHRDHSPAPPALDFDGVRAAYGRIEVLHGVDLARAGGSVFALLGPNGARQEHLLKVLNGRLRPTAGSVHDRGREPLPQDARAPWPGPGSCAIPEGRGVFPNLTVRDNLRMWTYRGGVSDGRGGGAGLRQFPRLRSGASSWPGRCRGASSRCWPSPGRWPATPRSCCSTRSPWAWPRWWWPSSTSWSARSPPSGVTVVVVEQFVEHRPRRGQPGRHHAARPRRPRGHAGRHGRRRAGGLPLDRGAGLVGQLHLDPRRSSVLHR